MKKLLCGIIIIWLALGGAAIAEEYASLDIPHSSAEFSMETALKILRLSLAQDARGAQTTFDAIDFTVVKTAHYDKAPSDPSHTSGYCIATGSALIRGERRDVAAVVVRGTVAGEWYFNFDFAYETGAEAKYAENFMAAAQDILPSLNAALEQLENPVIIATGYSRGAAVANLLGVLLSEQRPSDDVYIYTFATPNTIRGIENAFPNIFNIVNRNDPVTHMPLTEWGFSRAGTDIPFADPDFDNTQMNLIFLNALGVAPDIDAYYNARQIGGGTVFELFSSIATLMTLLPGDSFNMAMGDISSMTESDGALSRLGELFVSAFMAEGEANLFYQHMPEIYLELITSGAFAR